MQRIMYNGKSKDARIETDDAVYALKELKRIYDICENEDDKLKIKEVFLSYRQTTNALLRSVKMNCKRRGAANLLKNKNLDEIQIKLEV